MKNSRCLNPACPSYGTVGSRSIIHNGFYRTRSGKRRRYRCGECGKTFSSTKGTPYYRLQHRRATFDGVIALRVEGVSISAISRIKRDCLEHRRPLAQEGSPSVSSIQSQKDRWLRYRRIFHSDSSFFDAFFRLDFGTSMPSMSAEESIPSLDGGSTRTEVLALFAVGDVYVSL